MLEAIKQARKEFSNLEQMGSVADSVVINIENDLKRAEVGYEALDPEGKKSADDMRQEVEAKVKTANIDAAREGFSKLEQMGSVADTAVGNIETNLKRAEVGYDALDPEGKKSADDMRQEVEAKVKTANIDAAREGFSKLERMGSVADTAVGNIETNLKRAEVGYEALDPEGKKSADDMRQEVKAKVKTANIEAAREGFAKLERMGCVANTAVSNIEKNLKRAEVGYEALDPEGKKSADEMRREVRAKMHATPDRQEIIGHFTQRAESVRNTKNKAYGIGE